MLRGAARCEGARDGEEDDLLVCEFWVLGMLVDDQEQGGGQWNIEGIVRGVGTEKR